MPAHRSEEERIKALEAQIEALKQRKVQKQQRKDPTHRHMTGAVRSIDQALSATSDHATREHLNEARATLAACLAMTAGAQPKRAVLAPQARRGGVSEDALLSHIRMHPGSRGEAIAQALGTDTATVRPVMKKLIKAGLVKVAGQARAMSYAALSSGSRAT